MGSSGMGASEIRNLTYGNFIEAISEYYKPTNYELFDIKTIKQKLEEVKEPLILEWKIRRYKTGRPYVTFNTPEATETLLQHLYHMELNNKPIKSLDDYLFVGYNGQMHERTITNAFERINEACGFGRVGKYCFFRSHSLRHFFKTSLTNAGVEDLRSRSLMGQKGLDLGSIYDDPRWHDLKRDYLKALEQLSIRPLKARIIADKEAEKLYSEVETLQSENEALKEQVKIQEQQYQAKIASLETKVETIDEEMRDRVRKLEEKTKDMTYSDYMRIAKQLSKDENMQVALYSAAGIDVKALERLIDKGLDPKELEGWVQKGVNLKDAEFLIDEGVDPKKIEGFLIKDK